MPLSKEEARRQIAERVNKFERERNRQQSEADVRAGYIDLLFLALGWNVYNDPGQMTNYRREGYVRGAGYVDIGLEIRSQPRLFLEAKRFGLIPLSSQRAGDRTLDEKQAFRYARGKQITYAILTNFERLHLFNADHERLIYAFDSPQQYLDHFEELWRLSPEEVDRGSLSWWEGQLEKKDVDLEFLHALRRWRLELANAVYQHNATNPVLQKNGGFDFDRLMEAVQRILDRLILIRYGDDKEVLLAHDLLENMLAERQQRGAYVRPDHLMRAFIDLSHMMDEHHNTTLFEPGHVCEQVALPNEALAQVIEEMNRISFRKFTSDILGNTYESYLGTKLALSNGQIEDEERRDIRKGRGIYYTPRWVVEYIVDNTLGRRLKELEAEHGLHAIEKARGLAVLDPACGSGSFLIYAYQVLADFYRHLNQAILDEQTRLVADMASPDMFQRLERLKHLPQPVADYPQVILKEHLFGVDLDPEAAEIAAVNLTMQAFADSRQKKLPRILNENIKVGNSLISGTEAELRPYFGDAWETKHPFTWEREFPDIMNSGGFDVVVGNPPYGASFTEADRLYIEARYPSSKSNKNSAMVFIERGLGLTKKDGFVGYIVPKSLAFSQQWASGRSLIFEKLGTAGDASKAFKDVLLEQMIIICSETYSSRSQYESIVWDKDGVVHQSARVAKKLSNISGSVLFGVNDSDPAIFDKVTSSGLFLRHISKTARGLPFQKYLTKEPGGSPAYRGDRITRYVLRQSADKLPDVVLNTARKKVSFLLQPKVLTQRIVAHVLQPSDHIILMSVLDKEGVLTLDTVENTVLTDDRFALQFLVALVNSQFASWYTYKFIFSNAVRTMDFDDYYVGKLPLPCIDFANPAEKKLHDNLVALVERMLELNRRLAETKDTLNSHLEDLKREIERTDQDIDSLVYDLYGLTKEERGIVERETPPRSVPSPRRGKEK